MKTSLRKLRGLALHKRDPGDPKILPLAPLDELAKASEDMEDMTDCYDNLLSAAAAVANSAYEFSDSLREMGACLLQRIALNEDEEAGKAVMILGKVQFELQKLIDNYRSHISKTITVPSESLLNELHIVEEMKRKCDEKRELYEYISTRHKEQGRSKGGKGESFSSQQLEVARDEFDEEATLFVFRLKSLKQGQSRSLLTQAARHYAAQLSFFRKALKSLEAVEPHIKLVTKQQHIEYHFSGLDNDESEDGQDDGGDDNENATHHDSGSASVDDDGELSFDYHRNSYFQTHNSEFQKSVEENLDLGHDLIREQKLLSQSAPILPPREVDPAERTGQLRPSNMKKLHAYVLPTPGDTKSSHATGAENPASQKNNRAPPPLSERIQSPELNPDAMLYPNTIKRLSLSGPLTSEPIMSVRHSPYGSEPPQFSSGPILSSPPTPPLLSSKLSPTASPNLSSSAPRVNELHKLPKPPSHISHPASQPGFVGYSAPLMSRNPANSASSKLLAPLPTPPLPGSSMPPSNARLRTESSSSGPHESPAKSEEFASPPLAPILLSKPN